MSLEEEFHQEMIRLYQRTVKEIRDYNPRFFLDMVVNMGGVKTVKRLLSEPIQLGFSRLWEENCLDLTAEWHVVESKWAALFAQAEIEEARNRLQAHGAQLAEERGKARRPWIVARGPHDAKRGFTPGMAVGAPDPELAKQIADDVLPDPLPDGWTRVNPPEEF